jgi:Tol biopolymer transport system component
MPKHSMSLIIQRCAAILVLLLSASMASATDPGKNGKIAFFTLPSNRQIFTINPDRTDLFQVTNMPPTDDIFALWPDFSADGKQIVFPHDMTGALELYVINTDGTGLTQISHDGRAHIAPHWSPDGTHIVFGTVGELGLAVIATIRADGNDFRTLTTPVWDALNAEYTPDGKHIVFMTTQGGFVSVIWIMDTDGKHQRRLSDPKLEAAPPDVSPDGRQVVFNNHQNAPGQSDLFKMNLDGTGVIRLTTGPKNDGLPSFSPNGKNIIFVSDRKSPGSLDTWIMDTDGSHQRLLIEGAGAPNWGVQP